MLRAGGRCAFSVWEAAAANPALGVFYNAVEAARVVAPAGVPTGPPMFGFGDHGAFADLLRDAGFDDVAITVCSGTLRIAPEQWWESVLRSTPRTGTLIASQAPEVQAEIRANYDELVAPYADGDEVVLPVGAVLASGTAPNS